MIGMIERMIWDTCKPEVRPNLSQDKAIILLDEFAPANVKYKNEYTFCLALKQFYSKWQIQMSKMMIAADKNGYENASLKFQFEIHRAALKAFSI